MPNTVANTVDTTNGRISFSQVTTGGSTFTNSTGQTLATVRFNILAAGAASVTFNASAGNTSDTNVSSNGADILASVTNGSFTLGSPFDFSLAHDGNKSVVQGSNITNIITVTRTSGTAATVSFSATGLPSGAGASFTPTSCTPSTSCTSTMTITTLISTPTGTYPITVNGTSGGTTRGTAFNLTVNAANQAPVVDAGTNQTITLPAVVNLDGTVTDDGLPAGTLTTTWSMVSGPGTVTFGNASAIDTTASFSTSGTYSLRLTANDGALSASDTVTVTVNPMLDTTPPTRSNAAPTGTLPLGTTGTTISLATDENATCRYGTTAGVAYASLPNTFGTTGGSSHSSVVSGLSDGQSYTYYVRCEDSAGNANASDFAVSFSVAAPPPDFSLSLSTLTPSIIRGESGTVNVTATITSGSPGSAAFSVTGAPSGVTTSFSPTSCTPTCSTTLTITVASTVPVDTYPLTITGVSAAVTRELTLNLSVAPRSVTSLNTSVSLEALSTAAHVSSKTFTITIIDPTAATTVRSFTASPDASGNIAMSSANAFDEGTYDVRVVTTGYLSQLLEDQSIIPGSSLSVPALLSGDLNNDGIINSVDWSSMNAVWFTADSVSDINRDGIVNSVDFSFINKNWGLMGE
jgi:hypothetical protein